jgi:hypothetical protein
MRRCRAALTVIALTVLTFLVAGPAQAGGPTSVLLVVPGTGQTASLYYSDDDYNTLAGLVGAFGDTAAEGRVDRSGASHEFGAAVNVAWLIHDVMVYRVDRIYLAADHGPWIATQTDVSRSGNIWNSPVVWHTASGGPSLASLVDKLGVRPSGLTTGSTAAKGGGMAPSSAPSTAPAAAPKQSATKPTNSSIPGWSGLLWGLGGLALGVAVTVIAMRRSSSSWPRIGRQATVHPVDGDDLQMPAVPQGVDSEPTWSAAEELTWPARRR